MAGVSAPRPIPAGRVARGRVVPPPSKSVTHRYLNLALLSGLPAVVRRPLWAEDTRLFLALLGALGWGVEEEGETVRLAPPDRAVEAAELFCGNAGTLFRFATASLATLPGRWRLDGTERLRERPVGPLVAAVRALGGEIACPEREGYAPLDVRGGAFRGGAATLAAGDSSQYLSALLMAALRGREPTRLAVTALTSAPYVALTRAAIRRFAAGDDPVAETAEGYVVHPTALEPPDDLEVEGDVSAACYSAAAAALTGGEVEIAGVRSDSAQGDRGFFDLLARMGAEVSWSPAGVRVRGRDLVGVEVDLSSMPDQVPTLAALAPFARGATSIYNVAHLRIKESDRLRAMATGLTRLGCPVEEQPDGLVIPGCWAAGEAGETSPVARGDGETTVVDPVGDHRIAMSFALVGLGRPGVAVAHSEVVAKSYPAFWEDFDALLAP